MIKVLKVLLINNITRGKAPLDVHEQDKPVCTCLSGGRSTTYQVQLYDITMHKKNGTVVKPEKAAPATTAALSITGLVPVDSRQ